MAEQPKWHRRFFLKQRTPFEKPLPFESKGHTFELCRVRHPAFVNATGVPEPGLPALQEYAGQRGLNSAAWRFTKSYMFVGAWPVSFCMVSVMRS